MITTEELFKVITLNQNNKIENLEELTMKKILNKLGIIDEVTIEDININKKEIKKK